MLMITTTMGMLYWIHGNTSHLGPAVSLVLVLVVRASGLEKRLVKSSTSSNKSHHGSTVPIKVCVCVCVLFWSKEKKKESIHTRVRTSWIQRAYEETSSWCPRCER